MPQVQDYIVDPVLTNLSIAYKNMELIGTKIMPRVEVPSRTGFYYIWDKEAMKVNDDTRTGTSRAKRVDFGMTKAAYGPLQEHALEEAIEYEVRDTYSSPQEARVDATDNVSSKLDLGLEKAIAAIITSTSVMTKNITLSGTDQFSDYANSNPFAVIQTAIDSVVKNAFVKPNTMIMGYDVWSILRHHPDLLGRMSVNVNRTLTEQQMADLFGVANLYIGAASENTGVEGQADAFSIIWGKNIVVAYINPTPAVKQISLGYTLQVKGARYVDRWDEPQVKAEFVRANDYYQPKIVAPEAGYLIANAVA